MKKLSSILLGLLLLLFFLGYMVTFSVGHNQIAVKSTFGVVGEDSVYHGRDGTGRGVLGNLHFKWFNPIQSIETYSALVQQLDIEPTQIKLDDNNVAVVQLFVTWQITDAKLFYTKLRTEDEARQRLKELLRDATNQIASYRFEDLTNIDPAKLKITEAQQKIAQTLQATADASEYGITIRSVGIERLLLPSEVASKVFDQMKQTRETLASKETEAGKAEATQILSRADSIATQILSFANTRAEAIRSEGRIAVGEKIREFRDDPEFAEFLLRLQAVRQMLANNPTIIADPRMIPFDVFPQMKELEGRSGISASDDNLE